MKKFKVDLSIESGADPDSDPSFTTEVFAQDESQALTAAKQALVKEHPDVNFMKAWCWHIETLERNIS